nr:IS630 family transposase [Deinococcus sp. QL22]
MRRTWAPKGKTPIVRLPASWQKLSTTLAITSMGQFLQHTQAGTSKTNNVLAFLHHVLKQVPGEMVVVLDNAAIHRAKAVSAFVETVERLTLVYLPPYSPELNPIEKVWAYVKRNILVRRSINTNGFIVASKGSSGGLSRELPVERDGRA